jgi:hypothetical protein
MEIIEAVSGVFGPSGASAEDIIDAARSHGVRPEVLEILRRLPERQYVRANQLWEELTDLPVGV